jgi:hypothetical protein
MLEKAREYARNAGEAVDLAGKLEIGPERLALMHMAETWLRLAEAALDHARFMSMERSSGAAPDPAAPTPDAP